MDCNVSSVITLSEGTLLNRWLCCPPRYGIALLGFFQRNNSDDSKFLPHKQVSLCEQLLVPWGRIFYTALGDSSASSLAVNRQPSCLLLSVYSQSLCGLLPPPSQSAGRPPHTNSQPEKRRAAVLTLCSYCAQPVCLSYSTASEFR